MAHGVPADEGAVLVGGPAWWAHSGAPLPYVRGSPPRRELRAPAPRSGVALRAPRRGVHRGAPRYSAADGRSQPHERGRSRLRPYRITTSAIGWAPAAGARTDAAWRPFSCYSVRCQCLVPASAAATTTTVAAATAAASASAAVATAAALGRALLEAVAAVHRLITARLERYFRLLAAVRALRRVHLARARRVTASSSATVTASSAARIATGRFAGAPAIRAPLRLVGEASARVKLLIFRGECKFSPAVHAR